MSKIQLFESSSINALQSEVNGWLADHKDIRIVETNLTSLTRGNQDGLLNKIEGTYAFYILYIPADQEKFQSVLQASLEMPSELIDPNVLKDEIN
jgi:hypothetical protein